jgi:hypothetical protein
MRAKAREQYEKHKVKNAPSARARSAKWRAENHELYLEQMQKYSKANSKKAVARAAQWARANADKMRKHRRTWKRTHPEAVAAYDQKRYLIEIASTPDCITRAQKLAIDDVYKAAREITRRTGVEHQVDHIVPLLGKNVCGLHVAWNLRVITGDENARKSNKF